MIQRLNNNESGDIRPINFRYNPITQKVSIEVQEECKLNINYSDNRYSWGFHPTKIGNSEEISQNMVSSNPY